MALRREQHAETDAPRQPELRRNLISSEYSRLSSGSNSDTSDLTFNATAGIKLLLTNALALTAQYSYTNGSYGGYNYPMPSYNRNVFSFGVNYSF